MIRKIKLPDDLDLIIELLVTAFQYPENPEWETGTDEIEGYEDLIRAAKKFWPVLSILRLFSSYLRNVFTGLIWEEDEKEVGIALLQQLPTEGKWIGRSLAILPEYRRKGIARKMVEAALEMIQELNGDSLYGLVIDGNSPAITLYEQIGFVDYTSEIVLEHPGNQTPEQFQLSEDSIAQKRKAKDWRSAYEYACQNMPDQIKKFESTHIGDFKIPLYQRILVPYFDKLQGNEIQRFDYPTAKDNKIEGQATIELPFKGGGAVLASAASTPDNPEMAQFIVQHILELSAKYSPNRKIRMDVPGWQPEIIHAAQEAGFKKKLVYRKMVYLFQNLSPHPADLLSFYEKYLAISPKVDF